MKFFLLATTISLAFLGCSHNTAFDRFEMSSEREFSEESIQSTKIINEQETQGVVTVVYLNKVYPTLYKDAEYFYIYLNVEGESEKTTFWLNSKPSMYLEELPINNEFTSLTQFDADWKHYYLVGFKQEKKDTILKLEIKNEKSIASLEYKRKN
ncbi:MAG: hypothetical protein JXQ67_09750 [Campylobacterales bacterium]|nr:hypothetical protein [Campylobacterales bacterium]